MSEIYNKWNDIEKTWWIKSSSLEAQKSAENNENYANNLIKINNIFSKCEIEENEDKYREKLSKLDKEDLKQLLKLDNNKLENLLNKTSIEIKQELIQNQIKELI